MTRTKYRAYSCFFVFNTLSLIGAFIQNKIQYSPSLAKARPNYGVQNSVFTGPFNVTNKCNLPVSPEFRIIAGLL